MDFTKCIGPLVDRSNTVYLKTPKGKNQSCYVVFTCDIRTESSNKVKVEFQKLERDIEVRGVGSRHPVTLETLFTFSTWVVTEHAFCLDATPDV